MPVSGGRSWQAGNSVLLGVVNEGVWLGFPGLSAGPAEWSHMHPFGTLPGRGAMTMTSGTGLLSQVIERGDAGSCENASSPGAWRPSRLAGSPPLAAVSR